MNSTSRADMTREVLDPSDDVPEGWKLTNVGDVFEINPPKAPLDSLEPDEHVTFVPMPAVDADKGAITEPQERPFSEVRRGFTSFQDEDVIMAKITPCMENGKIAIARGLVNGLGFGSTEFHVLRSTGAVLPQYVYHFIRQESFRRKAEGEMTGSVGQKRVPTSFLEDTDLPVPPKEEQERIVESIEQLLIRIDAAHERLGRVPIILKRFRQAVLAAACSGRLTENWRETNAADEAGAELLVSKLRERNLMAAEGQWHEPSFELRDKKDLPQSWEYVALGNLGSWVSGGTPSKSNDRFWNNGTIPWLSPKDMKSEIIVETQDHITEAAVSESGLKKLPKDTLLFVVRGMILAHTFPVAISSCALTINQDIKGVKPFEEILPNYLLRAIQGEALPILFAVRESTHGTRRLESETLKCWPIPIPPFEEQSEIVRQVQILFNLADNIEKRVAAATARAEKLTQAILAKAFRGEFVPTEAELARREGRDYEPASALLARIRADRESNGSAPEKLRQRKITRTKRRSSSES